MDIKNLGVEAVKADDFPTKNLSSRSNLVHHRLRQIAHALKLDGDGCRVLFPTKKEAQQAARFIASINPTNSTRIRGDLKLPEGQAIETRVRLDGTGPTVWLYFRKISKGRQ